MEKFYYNQTAEKTLAAFTNGGRFPHAILLEGPAGSGRRTFARRIAAALCCRSEGPRPCGVCSQCHKVLTGQHPDIEEDGGDGGRRSCHIDAIRRIRREAYIRPGEAPCKVYILLSAENMTVQAQNALLKILEEPPAQAMFLLTAENRTMLLPTILSRVQVLRLESLTPAQIAAALAELRPGLPEGDRLWAAQHSETIGGALSLLEDPDQGKTARLADQVVALLEGGSEYELLAALHPLEKKRDALGELCEELRRRFSRELAAAAAGGEARFSARQLTLALDALDDLLTRIRQNGNALLLTTLLAARLKEAIG